MWFHPFAVETPLGTTLHYDHPILRGRHPLDTPAGWSWYVDSYFRLSLPEFATHRLRYLRNPISCSPWSPSGHGVGVAFPTAVAFTNTTFCCTNTACVCPMFSSSHSFESASGTVPYLSFLRRLGFRALRPSPARFRRPAGAPARSPASDESPAAAQRVPRHIEARKQPRDFSSHLFHGRSAAEASRRITNIVVGPHKPACTYDVFSSEPKHLNRLWASEPWCC